MTDAKSTLTRDGTMQVTAKLNTGMRELWLGAQTTRLFLNVTSFPASKIRITDILMLNVKTKISPLSEGIQYLEDSGHTKLLQMQGLTNEEKEKQLNRDSTMVATAKEGEKYKEGVDPDSFTRGQQKKIEEIQKEKADTKKTRLPKEGTMEVTAKEGKALLGDEKLGETRQETKSKANAKKPAGNKRESTIQKTMAEAKAIVSEEDLTGGRRTRSQNKPAPEVKTPVKRAGATQKAAKETKESKKAKKDKEAKETAENEKKDEEKKEEKQEEKKEEKKDEKA